MSFVNKFLIILIAFGAIFTGASVFAQDTSVSADVIAAVNLDEDISASDLGVGEPTILADNPFYFLKSAIRGIESFFTFDPVKKAELKQKFADQKLVELKKLAEIKPNDTESLDKAFNNYQDELTRLEGAVDGITDEAKADKFVDKFIDHNFRHQKLFGQLEKELPEEALDAMERIRKRNMDVLSSVSSELVSPEVLKDKIIEITDEQSGSQFKHFKNLEVLQALEDKVPEQAKEAIQLAQENSLKRLHGDLELMSPEDREKFKDYVGNIGGNEVRHLEIIHKFEAKEMPEEVRIQLEAVKEETFSKIEKKMKELGTKENQEVFLEHLGKDKLENLRIVNELESNLSPEVIGGVLMVKEGLIEKIKIKIDSADTMERREVILKEAEKYYDVKQMRALEEIQSVSNVEFLKELKYKVIDGMKNEIEGITNEKELRLKIDMLTGDTPEGMTIIQGISLSPQMTGQFLEVHAEKLERKIGNITDETRLRVIIDKIQGEDVASELRRYRPELLNEVNPSPETGCIEIWAPVCGENGKTYSNDCHARAAGIKIRYRGACEQGEMPVEKPTINKPIMEEPSVKPEVGLASPSAVYCQKLGYNYKTKTDSTGAVRGMCIFSNGDVCDAWEFYRGECGAQYKTDEAVKTPSLEIEVQIKDNIGTVEILPVEDVGF